MYIGRGTIWGNKFRIGIDGDRETVIAKYRIWLWEQIRSGEITIQQLAELHGKNLLCHCTPLPCHGDILMAAAKWAYNQLGEINQWQT